MAIVLHGADGDYQKLVKRASSGDTSVDFRALRFACLRDSNCDARGDSNDMAAMHKAMVANKYDSALKIAEKLVKKGFANIEAHATCARAYQALGRKDKAEFHRVIGASLVQSILKSGDGKTPETAFEVIGTFEEYITMSVLGLPPFGRQSLLPGEPHSYDLQEVQDPRTGTTVKIYFNIDAFYPPKL